MSGRKHMIGQLVAANLIFGILVVNYMVPISRNYTDELLGCVLHWEREAHFILAWERQLTESEIDELVDMTSGGRHWPQSTEHVIRHGDEPLLIDALIEASRDEDLKLSTSAEFLLFRLGHNADERWPGLLQTLETGGLDEDELYLLALEDDPEDDGLRAKRWDAQWRRGLAQRFLGILINPEQDSGRVPDLLLALESDDDEVKETIIWVLSEFRENHEARSALMQVAENDPDEDMRQQAQWRLEEEPYDWDYEAYVLHNRRGFLISILLIGAMIAGSTLLVRKSQNRVAPTSEAKRSL